MAYKFWKNIFIVLALLATNSLTWPKHALAAAKTSQVAYKTSRIVA